MLESRDIINWELKIGETGLGILCYGKRMEEATCTIGLGF